MGKEKIIVFAGILIITLLGSLLSAPHGLNALARVVNQTAAQQKTPPGFLTYVNGTLGMKIQYPSNWTKILSPRGLVLHYGANSSFAQVGVSVYPGASNLSVNQTVTSLINNLTQSHPEFQLLLNQPTVLGNNSGAGAAKQIVYTYRDSTGVNFKVMKVFTSNAAGDERYTISFFAQPDRYDGYLPTVQKMIDSFQILAMQPTSGAAAATITPAGQGTGLGTATTPTSTTGGHHHPHSNNPNHTVVTPSPPTPPAPCNDCQTAKVGPNPNIAQPMPGGTPQQNGPIISQPAPCNDCHTGLKAKVGPNPNIAQPGH